MPRLVRVAIWSVALCVAVFVGLALAYLFLPPMGKVSPKTVAYSVARHFKADVSSSPCQRLERSRYRCFASDGSGGTEYRVTLHGHCWKATRAGNTDARFGARGHGCLHWRDQLRLFERFLDAI